MKSRFAILGLSLFLFACSAGMEKEAPAPAFSAEGKQAIIYTTADSTDLRLAQTASKPFGPAKQPLETEVAIFVNPNKTFQSLLGIGGAITDASAEVFATLPEKTS